MFLVPETMCLRATTPEKGKKVAFSFIFSSNPMFKKVQIFHQFMESFIKIFNFTFFVASITFWIIITIKNISTQPFEIGLLWSAFNEMYGQLSFKIGCIFLIIFNGFASIRGILQQYMDLAEQVQHTNRIKRFLTTLFSGKK